MQAALTEILFLALLFFVGLAAARVLMPLSRRLATVVGALDRPDQRKRHVGVVPRLGGLAITVAFLFTLLVCVRLDDIAAGFLAGALIVALTGLLDDIFEISPRLKFLGEIMAALTFVGLSGFQLHSFGDLLGIGEIRTGILAPAVTVFCLVGVMNALNLSDGLDGLAGGIGFIAAFFLAVLAYELQAMYWLAIALSLLGVLLGFLRHNHYPASLFMGDTGSLLIGYSLAATAVGLVQTGAGSRPASPITLAIMLSLPIADTVWVMTQRLLQGRNPLRPDRTHLHHRLQKLGLGHGGVVVLIYVIMLGMGFLAWYGRSWPDWLEFLAVLVLLAIIYGGLLLLELRQVNLGRWFDRLRLFRRRQSWNVKDGAVGWGLRSVMLFLPFGLVLPFVVLLPLGRVSGLLALGAALLMLLLYPWRAARRCLPLGQGVFYLAVFVWLLLLIFAPDKPPWLLPLLYGAAVAAGICTLLLVSTSSRSRLLYPCGLELLFLFVSWALPLVVLPMLGVSPAVRYDFFTAAILALPLFCLGKLFLRRSPRRNFTAAVLFFVIFLFLGFTAWL